MSLSTLAPADINMPQIVQHDIYGGTTALEAAQIFHKILSGQGTLEQNAVVIANAAFAIQLFQLGSDISDCIEEAKESLESGKALKVLEGFK